MEVVFGGGDGVGDGLFDEARVSFYGLLEGGLGLEGRVLGYC